MQKDFHFYATAVLARAAGYSAELALTIGYAAQYVDDATESEPIRVGDLLFDPVRTAHYGLKAYSWSVQKKVYIPFHFLPPRPVRPERIQFKTAPARQDDAFATELLLEALHHSTPELWPYRVGVALHTFADTWSHQGFSGRKHDENDVEAIDHFTRIDQQWHGLWLPNVYLDVLPKIGHTQAGHFPDQPFLCWRHLNPTSDLEHKIERDNTNQFLEAAGAIYQRLTTAAGGDSEPKPWDTFAPQLLGRLQDPDDDVDHRCQRWQREFGDWFEPHSYRYDHRAWRNDALEPEDEADTDWNEFEQSDFKRLQFKRKRGFYDSSWVRFHRAALLQRHYVLERLL